MTDEKLKEILDKHSKWLNNEDEGECADLSGAYLRNADLRYAILSGANLDDADLSGANLRYADLSQASLRYVRLNDANLRASNLVKANLYGSNLIGADLRGANLRGTNLRATNFAEAILRDANLRDAELVGVDLRYANLLGADLRGANFAGVAYAGTALNPQCPEEDSFTAWKKLADDNIAKLLIPEDAKRSSATTRKCRANKAVVLAIYNKRGEEISEGKSRYAYGFVYRVGETVYPDKWDEDRWNECSSGIHFFLTRREAEEY